MKTSLEGDGVVNLANFAVTTVTVILRPQELFITYVQRVVQRRRCVACALSLAAASLARHTHTLDLLHSMMRTAILALSVSCSLASPCSCKAGTSLADTPTQTCRAVGDVRMRG